jgi:hypothetical protein
MRQLAQVNQIKWWQLPYYACWVKIRRQKIEADMEKYAKERVCTYFEVSAKEDYTSIGQLFLEVMNIVV